MDIRRAMKKYDYLIVGAGLFGAVFAQRMTEQGKKCLVIDKRSTIAGNIYTEEVNDIQVHRYGAHIFHTSDEEVWNYVNGFAEWNSYINSPVASWKDELYNLPFNMNTFSKMWGIKTPAEAKEIIAKQSREAVIEILEKRGVEATEEAITSFEPANLEEQGLYLAGRDIFEKLVKGYTEKQWGRSCSELPAFIIKRLPFRFIYDNNYFNDLYQGIPIGGYTAMVERMLENVDVQLDTDFYDFLKRDEKGELVRPFTAVAGAYMLDEDLNEEVTFDKIVFTGMIDEFYNYQLGTLEYRSLRFETEELPDEDNYQGNAVVNYTEREVPYTRIIEHKHFEFGKKWSREDDKLVGKDIPGTIITREYPATWEKGDEPYYPMNDEKNNALYAKYRELAKKDKDVIFGGRLGQYKYYNMDQVIRAALDEAHKIWNYYND